MHRVATGHLGNLQKTRIHIHHHQKIRYFLNSSLLLVECGRIKILTNFCFCNPRTNQDENFWF
ncbi:hypothetical protein ACSBR2_012112 [Camellia fascicularis]